MALPDRRVRVVGTPQAELPALSDVTVTTDWDTTAGLVAVTDGCGDIFTRLHQTGELLVPVADFTSDGLSRWDCRGDRLTAPALKDALVATADLRARVNGLPAWAVSPEEDGLTALALALTRDTGITARWAPNSPEMVHYPILAGLPRQRPVLEGMAEAGLLTRQFFDRLHLCRHCGGARLVAREICPACGSANLGEMNLVHHYRCGHQAPKPNFESEATLHLVCPKCHRTIRHYGVDYDVPGSVVVCQTCGETAAEPDAAFTCGDCTTVTPTTEAATRDWFHYGVTSEGERAVSRGRLPQTDLAELIRGVPGQQSPRDLGVLINFSRRVHNRYHRPFFVLLVRPAPSEDIPPAQRRRAYGLIGDVVRSTLRESDFVTALGDELVILLPETPSSDAEIVRTRLQNQLAQMMGAFGRVDIQTVESEGLDVLEDQLKQA